LAEARGRAGDKGPVRIPSGPALKVGMKDARVPLIRERLAVTGDAGDTTYDKPLAEAVKADQRQKGLGASGTLTAATIDALNVPRSIVQNAYLPALAQDPGALERIALKVEYSRDGTVHIFQPPGDRNALGRIRFNFPNKFLVYQHDTPDKHLFAHDKRAYSHG